MIFFSGTPLKEFLTLFPFLTKKKTLTNYNGTLSTDLPKVYKQIGRKLRDEMDETDEIHWEVKSRLGNLRQVKTNALAQKTKPN